LHATEPTPVVKGLIVRKAPSQRRSHALSGKSSHGTDRPRARGSSAYPSLTAAFAAVDQFVGGLLNGPEYRRTHAIPSSPSSPRCSATSARSLSGSPGGSWLTPPWADQEKGTPGSGPWWPARSSPPWPCVKQGGPELPTNIPPATPGRLLAPNIMPQRPGRSCVRSYALMARSPCFTGGPAGLSRRSVVDFGPRQ